MWDNESLLAATAEDFTLLVKKPVSDGLGGFTWTWTDGPTFQGVLMDDQGTNARIGAIQTATTFGWLKTSKSVDLKAFDAFRRELDGVTFRVSDKNNSKTPPTSSMDIKQYPVEQWSIPE